MKTQRGGLLQLFQELRQSMVAPGYSLDLVSRKYPFSTRLSKQPALTFLTRLSRNMLLTRYFPNILLTCSSFCDYYQVRGCFYGYGCYSIFPYNKLLYFCFKDLPLKILRVLQYSFSDSSSFSSIQSCRPYSPLILLRYLLISASALTERWPSLCCFQTKSFSYLVFFLSMKLVSCWKVSSREATLEGVLAGASFLPMAIQLCINDRGSPRERLQIFKLRLDPFNPTRWPIYFSLKYHDRQYSFQQVPQGVNSAGLPGLSCSPVRISG